MYLQGLTVDPPGWITVERKLGTLKIRWTVEKEMHEIRRRS